MEALCVYMYVCVCVCFWVRVFKVVSWSFTSHEALFEVLPKLVKTLSLMFNYRYLHLPTLLQSNTAAWKSGCTGRMKYI